MSWLRALPATWRESPPKALFRERREQSLPDDIHLTPSQTYGVLPQAEYMEVTGNRVVLNLTGQEDMKHVEQDDFIIHLRSFQGGIERSKLRGKVSTAYTVIEPRPGVEPAFFRWLLKSDGYIQELRTTTNQLRDGQSIRYRDFIKILLPVPPLIEQRAIADFLDNETAQIDELITEQQRLIELLIERAAAALAAALEPRDGWVASRVKHFAETTLGKMLDAGRTPRIGDQPIPYIRAADVLVDGLVNVSNLNEMPFSTDEMERLDLRAGDVLLIEGGATVGRPGFVAVDAVGISFQKTVNRVRVSSAEPRFVYWSLRSLYDSGFYNSYYGSVSFAHLTGEKLREIPIWLPPVAEQRAIAANLDEQTAAIDTLIAETERFIELARERRAALITAAVTGQIQV